MKILVVGFCAGGTLMFCDLYVVMVIVEVEQVVISSR